MGTSAPKDDAGSPVPACPTPVTEVEARLLIDESFRNLGLRIRNDVLVTGNNFSVTLDGFDPEQAVGYEFVSEDERGVDPPAEVEALGEAFPKVLVISACGRKALEAELAAFLATLAGDSQNEQDS